MREIAKVNYVIELFVRAANIHAVSVKTMATATAQNYAENELAYHKAVNALVGDVFIPNIDNAEVKALFEEGLKIFQVHQGHAEMMVKALK